MYETDHGVGKRFLQANLSQLDRKYFGDVLHYAENYKKYLANGEGLLLSGSVGCGKTYAMVALMRYLKKILGGRFDYYVVTAPLLMERYVPNFFRGEQDDAFRGVPLSKTYENVSGLVLNDLGKEPRINDRQEEEAIYKLGRLLRARNEEQLPIFITTNLNLSKGGQTFKSVYGNSVWSLVQEMTCVRIEINAPDRRKEKADRDLERLT